MRKFLNRALKKIGKLNIDQIRSLIMDVVQENELLEMVLYSMTDGVVVLDEKHSVILLNKAAERLFPFKNGDVVERPLWDALADSSLSEFFHKALVEHENIEDKEISLQTSASTRVLSCTMMPPGAGRTYSGRTAPYRGYYGKEGQGGPPAPGRKPRCPYNPDSRSGP